MHNVGPLVPHLTSEATVSWLSRTSESCLTRQPTIFNGQSARGQRTAGAEEPFLSGSSGGYVEEMYAAWMQDPKSVHAVSIYL